MIKRPTWILLGVLVIVVGAYFAIKNRPPKAGEATPTAQGNSYLITPADGNLQSIQIVDAKGTKFRMQRDLTKTWVITAPSNGEADQAQAGAAQTQVGALRIIITLDTPPDPGATHLAAPADTIDLTFDSGREHKIEVGGLTPTSSGYYVRFDGTKVYVIAPDGIEALLNLVKSPPFPPTATPQIAETPTP
jgi:hypothetical protein